MQSLAATFYFFSILLEISSSPVADSYEFDLVLQRAGYLFTVFHTLQVEKPNSSFASICPLVHVLSHENSFFLTPPLWNLFPLS